MLGIAALTAAGAALAPAAAATEEIRTAQARQQETGFGNQVADAIRAATRADIAWVAGGEFRDIVLHAGTGSGTESLAMLEDASDPLVVVSLTGRSIREALEI